ncbi:MAG: cell division protein FtsQ/DivIB [Sarcina sp.]
MRKMKSREVSERVDAYLKKKDKLKRRKKVFFLILVFLVAVIVFIFKAPLFEVKDIAISGNKMVKKEGVLDKKIVSGKNIFLLDTNQVKAEVLKNPYIQTAEVTRKVPNQILVKVTERKMFYKMKQEEKVYILNNELYIMDIVDDDKNLSLVEVDGIKIDSKNVGERITKSNEISRTALEIAENLIDKNKESIFTKVDLRNSKDVSIYKGEVEIILGELIGLDEKYKKAMEILNSKDIKLENGYIDVSVPSQPVIKLGEMKKEESIDDKTSESEIDQEIKEDSVDKNNTEQENKNEEIENGEEIKTQEENTIEPVERNSQEEVPKPVQEQVPTESEINSYL